MKSPAERLDHYQLQGLLGEGGMAKVYQALDTKLQRTVAIKVLTHEQLHTPKGEARFRREAQLAASLRHPNIVTVFDCSPAGSPQHYLVTELVTGGSLRDRISPEMLAEEAALLMLGVAQALGAAHLKGIVHRDVKPDNILIDHQQGDTLIKLTDFGVALDAAAPRVTTDGSISGSVHYMAPEQIKEGEALPASDVWAAGVTLLELVQGQHPFSGLTLGQIVEQVLAGDLPRPAEDVPPALQAILTRCLQLDPAARFADGNQLAEALERALESWGLAHPREEIQRWGRDPGYRQDLAARIADLLIQRAGEARSITDRANLLDRALLLVPHHERALALLASPASPSAQANPASPSAQANPASPSAQAKVELTTSSPSDPAQRRGRGRWLVVLSLCLLAGTLVWLLRGPTAPSLPDPPLLKPARVAPVDPAPAPAASANSVTTDQGSDRSTIPLEGTAGSKHAGPKKAAPKKAAPKKAAPKKAGAAGQRVSSARTTPGKKRRSRPKRAIPRSAGQRVSSARAPGAAAGGPTPARSKPGAVVLTTSPWAQVFLDGQSLGFTPKISRIPLAPGNHRLLLQNPLCEPASLELSIRSGEILVRNVTLKVLPARVKVEAPPGWLISVDGSRIGAAPLPALNLEHGEHLVEARSPAGIARQQRVRAVAGKLVTIQIKEPR